MQNCEQLCGIARNCSGIGRNWAALRGLRSGFSVAVFSFLDFRRNCGQLCRIKGNCVELRVTVLELGKNVRHCAELRSGFPVSVFSFLGFIQTKTPSYLKSFRSSLKSHPLCVTLYVLC